MLVLTIDNSTRLTLYRFLLGAIALLLLLLLWGCAAGSSDGKVETAIDSGGKALIRVMLSRSQAGDSVSVVHEVFVDQSLVVAFDSIDAVQYIPVAQRDSVATAAGMAVDDVVKKLAIDLVAETRIRRLGSMLGVEMRMVNSHNGREVFRDVAWSFIRYRDTTGRMFLGPTLYDALRVLTGRAFARVHTASAPIATEPIVIANVNIPRDPALGRIALLRPGISTQGVKAIGELVRRRFPEFVPFDYASRIDLYRLVNLAAVEDHQPVGDLERRAMFNVGIDYFVTAGVRPLGADSLDMRVEMRYVTSAATDSVVDSQRRVAYVGAFQTSTAVEDMVVALLDIAEPMLERQAERLRLRYEERRRRVQLGAYTDSVGGQVPKDGR